VGKPEGKKLLGRP